ncbi:hypothetical protein PR048_010492 [Dryococelus australis]|uniref:Uncharacterized protein n=1 Tax=Dryococelus australis TaxID=614101 RepID=A0ABQ9I2W9_9NEOP|nr:hypothetical protein PR048_010492 [Dryococelus australis]
MLKTIEHRSFPSMSQPNWRVRRLGWDACLLPLFASPLEVRTKEVVYSKHLERTCRVGAEARSGGGGENKPSTKANRVQPRPGHTPDFRRWESCRTIPLVGVFSRGSPVYPRPFNPALLHTRLASPTSALHTSMLRAAQIFSLTERIITGTEAKLRRVERTPSAHISIMSPLAKNTAESENWNYFPSIIANFTGRMSLSAPLKIYAGKGREFREFNALYARFHILSYSRALDVCSLAAARVLPHTCKNGIRFLLPCKYGIKSTAKLSARDLCCTSLSREEEKFLKAVLEEHYEDEDGRVPRHESIGLSAMHVCACVRACVCVCAPGAMTSLYACLCRPPARHDSSTLPLLLSLRIRPEKQRHHVCATAQTARPCKMVSSPGDMMGRRWANRKRLEGPATNSHEANMEQRRNARPGEKGDPRGNLPTSGIVRHYSHMRIPGSDTTRDRTRFAYVGGEYHSMIKTTEVKLPRTPRTPATHASKLASPINNASVPRLPIRDGTRQIIRHEARSRASRVSTDEVILGKCVTAGSPRAEARDEPPMSDRALDIDSDGEVEDWPSDRSQCGNSRTQFLRRVVSLPPQFSPCPTSRNVLELIFPNSHDVSRRAEAPASPATVSIHGIPSRGADSHESIVPGRVKARWGSDYGAGQRSQRQLQRSDVTVAIGSHLANSITARCGTTANHHTAEAPVRRGLRSLAYRSLNSRNFPIATCHCLPVLKKLQQLLIFAVQLPFCCFVSRLRRFRLCVLPYISRRLESLARHTCRAEPLMARHTHDADIPEESNSRDIRKTRVAQPTAKRKIVT